MQYELLNILKCPLTKANLKFLVISEFKKTYSGKEVSEIREGILFSPVGFVFPIIDGIPRMLIEGIYDYWEFLSKNIKGYPELVKNLEAAFPGLIEYCKKKNKKSKKSFAFEWHFLNVKKKDKLWHNDQDKLGQIFERETGTIPAFWKNKLILDVGSGHGLMTTYMASVAKYAIGIELSKAVEESYKICAKENAFFIQGDLQFLPFQNTSFDLLYSSGVIHHTNNTELSLSLIEPMVKNGGKICLWLYHPRKNFIHKILLMIRRLTVNLPLSISFLFILVFIFPLSIIIKTLKGKKMPKFREEMIDLLDHLTPEFRFETKHDVAIFWLERRGYSHVKVSTTDQFGFSLVGIKL